MKRARAVSVTAVVGCAALAACNGLVGVHDIDVADDRDARPDLATDGAVDATDVRDAAAADTRGNEASSSCVLVTDGGAPGSNDPTFQGGYLPFSRYWAHETGLLDDQARIYSLASTTGCGGGFDIGIVRYDDAGVRDLTYGSGGFFCQDVGGSEAPYAAAIDGKGRLVVVGGSGRGAQEVVALLRVMPNGTPDGTFNAVGAGQVPASTRTYLPDVPDAGNGIFSALGVAIDGNGFVVVGERGNPFVTPSGGFIAKFREDGEVDPTFAPSFDPDVVGYGAVTRVADGFLVAGTVGASFLVRKFKADGTVATTFGAGGTALIPAASGYEARAMVVQSDGKVLAAGGNRESFASAIVGRVTANGTLDTTFGTGGRTILSGVLWSEAYNFGGLAQQCDGKTLVGGSTLASGLERAVVARLDVQGALDPSYGSGGLSQLTVDAAGHRYAPGAIAVDPRTGKLVLLCSFDGPGLVLGRFNP